MIYYRMQSKNCWLGVSVIISIINTLDILKYLSKIKKCFFVHNHSIKYVALVLMHKKLSLLKVENKINVFQFLFLR